VITLCNQNRISVADFHPENGGIRLQQDALGRILSDWEEHWIGGGHDQALDQWVERLVGLLRQWATLSSALPDKPDEPDL
jgi:hypothetical protein